MILNMPVNSGAANSPESQGQTEYTNFLKRKYSEQEIGHTSSPTRSAEFQSLNTNCNNNWKKRHIDSEGQTNYDSQNSSYSIQPYKSLTANNTNASNEEMENNENQDANTGTFNIIANSCFINDLFAYDANLIVPVAANPLSDNVLSQPPIFSSNGSVCPSATAEYDGNGDTWQSSDLLELDHRYNSSLQTEISQLHPTVNLKNVAGEVHSFNANTSSDLVEHPTSHQETSFLLAPKAITPQNCYSVENKRLPSSSPVASSSSALNAFANDNPEQDCDFEDKNLSWLLNFKFDEFPHLNPDVASTSSNMKSSKPAFNTDYCNTHNSTVSYSAPNSSVLTSLTAGKSNQTYNPAVNASSVSDRSKSPKSSTKASKKFEELVMEVTSETDGGDMNVVENVTIEESSSHRA